MKIYEWDNFRIRVSEKGGREWFVHVPDSFGNYYWAPTSSADDDMLDALFGDNPTLPKLVEVSA